MGKFVAGAWMIWIILQVMAFTIQDVWFDPDDVAMIEGLTTYNTVESPEDVRVGYPTVSLSFVKDDLPRMIAWQFPFLAEEWEIVKWIIFYPISAAISLGLIAMFASVLFGAIRR